MASGLSFSSSNRFINQTVTQRSRRAVFFLGIVTLALSTCAFRLAQLQLVQGPHNRQLAENNRIVTLPMPSDRGNILDRKGRLLAANRLTRAVYLWPREQSPDQWKAFIPQLARILNIPTEEIFKKMDQAGYKSAMPIRISRDLTPNAFVALAELSQSPGLEIRAESSRYYPNGDMAAHVLGYIAEATAEDLKAHPNYPIGMLLGRMGIERLADRELQGVWGGRLIEVDASGREVRMLGVKPSVSGQPLKLTLDLDLQKTAERALNKRRGAVVVLDVKTGAVLALASGPTFDPNMFTRRISSQEWQTLQNQDKPFLNRALQGYPPGSTFKIVTTAAGIQSGKFSPDSTLGTASYISLGGVQFHEHGDGGYGVIGFREALTVSSNTFFYQVGLATGPEQISKWGHLFGIGETTDLGLDGGSHGLIPTPEQKEKLYKEPWYGGDTVSMAIGQGLVQVTPLEMAVMVSTIANGGFRVKPHLIGAEDNSPESQPQAIGLSPGTIAVIREGLAGVVREGTARQLSDGSIPPTAGKTGTAEVPGQPDNALYVGFGPLDKPQIAIAVVVENGGFGAVSAVPIAHEIYKTYFGVKGPKPAEPQSP